MEFNQFKAEIEQDELIHQEKEGRFTQPEENIQDEIQRELEKEKEKQANEFDHLEKIAQGKVNIAPITLTPKKTQVLEESPGVDDAESFFDFSWRSKQF